MKLIYLSVIGLIALLGGFFIGYHPSTQKVEQGLGAFSPTGGGTYRLGQSIGTTDSSFKLSSFKEPVSGIAYTMAYLGSDVGYGTISPQTSVSEFVSFTGITQNTDGSALLTGISRGISRTPGSGGCVASTTLAQPHAGQSIFILSNQPCFYVNEYMPLRNTATSSAVTIFGSTTPPRYDFPGAQAGGTYNATTSEFASIAYVNAIAIAGVSNATQTVKGIVELATGAEAGSSTPTGGTAASLALFSVISTSSPFTAASVVPVTMANGKLKQVFLDLTENFNFTGNTLIKNLFASSTVANPLTLNGLTYSLPSARAGSSTVLMENGSGALTFERPDFGLISSTTLSAAVGSTTVSSIPNVADLHVVIDIPKGSQATDNVYSLQFNADVNANYAWHLMDNGGNNTAANSSKVIRIEPHWGTAGTGSLLILDISNVPGRFKTLVSRGAQTGDLTANGDSSGYGEYNGTAAISSITIGGTDANALPIGTNIRIYGSAN